MMQYCGSGWGCGMGWGMGLTGLLAAVVLALAIAALVKYLGATKS